MKETAMKTNEYEYMGKLPVQLECERLRKSLCCYLSFLQDEHFDAFIKVLENGIGNRIDALRAEEEYRTGEYSEVIERFSYDRSIFLKIVREDIEPVEDLKEYTQKYFLISMLCWISISQPMEKELRVGLMVMLKH